MSAAGSSAASSSSLALIALATASSTTEPRNTIRFSRSRLNTWSSAEPSPGAAACAVARCGPPGPACVRRGKDSIMVRPPAGRREWVRARWAGVTSVAGKSAPMALICWRQICSRQTRRPVERLQRPSPRGYRTTTPARPVPDPVAPPPDRPVHPGGTRRPSTRVEPTAGGCPCLGRPQFGDEPQPRTVTDLQQRGSTTTGHEAPRDMRSRHRGQAGGGRCAS